MKRLTLKTNAQSTDTDYHFTINYFIFEEDGRQIAYCPALDLSTSGATYNEAMGNFLEAFQLHIECCVEFGTLYEDLKAHGWTLSTKTGTLKPPTFNILMRKPEMKHLMNSTRGFERIALPARMPRVIRHERTC